MNTTPSRQVRGSELSAGMTLVGDRGGLSAIFEIETSGVLQGLLRLETEHGPLYLDPDETFDVVEDVPEEVLIAAQFGQADVDNLIVLVNDESEQVDPETARRRVWAFAPEIIGDAQGFIAQRVWDLIVTTEAVPQPTFILPSGTDGADWHNDPAHFTTEATVAP